MGIFGRNPDAPTKINKIQINQSVLGFPVPVGMGKVKVQQSLLWIDGLSAKAVSQGGKGLGGGKGGSSYLYSADLIAALVCGPINGVGDVWSGQSWLNNINTSENYTVAGGSPSYTPVNASSGVFADAGVGMPNSYSTTQTDLGAGAPATVSGTDLAPMTQVTFGTTLTTGKYSIDTSNVYHFATADVGKTVTINYSFALDIIKQQENDIVPSGKTINIGGGFTFHQDFGVKYFTGPSDGVALTKVSGTPTVTGTYSVTGSAPAVYKFAPGDVNAEVQITYQIQNASIVPTGAPGTLNFSVFEGTRGQAVWSLLTSRFPQSALGYTGISYVAYNPMTLGYAADVQQNVFEVITPDAYGSGIVDCNPVTCFLRVLTDTTWGLGAGAVPFPTSAIDNGGSGSWGGAAGTAGARTAGATAWNWFASNGFFISPLLDQQDSAASLMAKWLEAGQCAAFMSEGLLKLAPYGDTTTAGNGATWTAPTAFAAALDDTCFINKRKGEDPVEISSSPWQDAYNTVQVQWSNRSNQYAPEITPESMQAEINRYGSRIEDPQNWDFIRTLQAATFAASTRVKRNVFTRNTYKFSLGYAYSYLECMDVVAISTQSAWSLGLNNTNLGVVNLPVRIINTVDNPDGTLDIIAEDYPFGVHQPTIFNKAVGAGQVQQNIFVDPGNTEAVLFEATSRLTGFDGNQIWMGACGVSENWGGCNILASSDGTTYKQIGTIKQVARLGTLHSTLAAGFDPDTFHTLVVDMAENSAPLEAGTTSDADAYNTLCFVDGELISYSACTATGIDQYTMGTYLRRGVLGSVAGAHSAGSLFLRLDDSVFKFTYDPTWAGKTLSFKFQSFNTFGNATQDPSTLTPVSFTVPGLNPGSIDASSGLVIHTGSNFPTVTGRPAIFNSVGAGPLGWTPIAASSDSTINYDGNGYSWAGASSFPAGVQANQVYARWTGYLIPTVTGLYTIGVNSDDGANVYIGPAPIVQNLTASQGANATTLQYTQSGKIALTAGVAYPITIEYQQGTGTGGIQLLWTPPGGSVALIPTANLSTSSSSVTGTLFGAWWNGTVSLWYPTGNSVVDPSGTGVIAKGSTPQSISATALNGFTWTTTSTSITFAWSQTPIFRSDGSITVIPAGTQAITGLLANNSYAAYPFYDEMSGTIKWVGSELVFPNITGVTLNGSTGYVETSAAIAFGTGQNFSVEAWIKTTSAVANGIASLSTPQTAITNTAMRFQLNVTAGGGLQAALTNSGSTVTNIAASGTSFTPVNDGNWHHVVFTYTAGIGTLYLDGVAVGANAAMGTINSLASAFWHIGFSHGNSGYPTTTNTFFNGSIAHAVIFSAALSAAQVANHFQAGVNQGETVLDSVIAGDSPTYYWKLAESSGTSAADSAGTNTGTYLGGFTLHQLSAVVVPDGSPAILWPFKTFLCTQAQGLQSRLPLSAGSIAPATPASGSGSGGGGGVGGGGRGGCFSGNTKVRTRTGSVSLEEFVDGTEVFTAAGTWCRANLRVHETQTWGMLDMGNGELVTTKHWILDGRWTQAEAIFDSDIQIYRGRVYDLEVVSGEPLTDEYVRSIFTEHSYMLQNRWIAHNLLPK